MGHPEDMAAQDEAEARIYRDSVLAETLWAAHALEVVVRNILSHRLAKDAFALDLIDDLLIRMDFPSKVRLLDEVMKHDGHPSEPTVSQVRELNEFRNKLAHGVWTDDCTSEVLFLVGRKRRGSAATYEFRSTEIDTLLTGAAEALKALLPMTSV